MTDKLLEMLIEFVEGKHRHSVAITLAVHGMIVTGELIPAEEYMKAFAEKYELGETEEKIKQFYNELFKPLHADERPLYVHLNNADINGMKIGFWRAKAESVDGIAIGAIRKVSLSTPEI